jgi:hypothetical protein
MKTVVTTGKIVETLEFEDAKADLLLETLGHFVIREDSEDGIQERKG